MDELKDRFAALDRITVPDLRSDIDRRVTDAAGVSRAHGQVTWRADGAHRLSPMLILLLLSLLLALALAFVAVGSRLPNLWTSVLPSPSPSPTIPTERIAVGPDGGFVPAGSMSDVGCAMCQAVVLHDGRVLVVGAAIGQIYDPATWTFTAAEGLPHAGPAILLDDGRVLVALTDELALYDPATGTSELIEDRVHVGGAAVRLADGRVLLVGREPASEGPDSAVTFDPRTNTLSATGATSARWSDPTLVPLEDGRVLVVGGSSAGRSAELYDPATGTFSATGSMRSQRGGFTATRLADGRVLIVGGQSGTETLTSAEIYDPASGTFTLTGSMDMPRFWHAAAPLPDGRVLVVGGGSAVRVDVGTFTEIYDPQTGQFTRGPVTNQPRVAATAASLPSGVLVLGHYPGNAFGGNDAAGRTAELFTLGPVERPVGCCLDNPGFISVSATAAQAAARQATLVVPAGALEGAVRAPSALISFDWPGGGTGHSSELSLPNCSEGCSIPIGLSAISSVPQDAFVTVTVDIAYQGPPPPHASGIEVVIDAND
ncbi:hypothetical protein BH23CHL7_BH23CHL7_19510 [soil metagenome]